MSWLGLLLLVLCAWLAYKLVGALLKLAMFLLALVGAYWFLAPYFGWPTVPELLYAFGPDLGGARIGELADPAELARRAASHVVDGVMDHVGDLLPGDAPGQVDRFPEPLPEPPAAEGGVDAGAEVEGESLR